MKLPIYKHSYIDYANPLFNSPSLQKEHIKILAGLGIYAIFINYEGGCCTGPTTVLITSEKPISWLSRVILWFRYRPSYPCYH